MQNPYSKYQTNKVSSPKKDKKTKKSPPMQRRTRRKVQKSKSSKESLPLGYIALSFVGLSVSFFILMYTDEFIHVVKRIEIGYSKVMADDGAEKNTVGEKNTTNSKEKLQISRDVLKPSDGHLTMKNASVYDALKNKRIELEKKERRLARLEEELHKQKEEIEKQLKELMSIRRNISSKLDKKVTADQESVNKLVGVYSNMKPQNAAIIISQLDEELAVKVLSKMKKQNAASILNFVKPIKAQTLSEKYAGLKK